MSQGTLAEAGAQGEAISTVLFKMCCTSCGREPEDWEVGSVAGQEGKWTFHSGLTLTPLSPVMYRVLVY